MSRNLLYHGFGIGGYQYVRTEYLGGQVVHHPPRAQDSSVRSVRLARRPATGQSREAIPIAAHRRPRHRRGFPDPSRRLSGLRCGPGR